MSGGHAGCPNVVAFERLPRLAMDPISRPGLPKQESQSGEWGKVLFRSADGRYAAGLWSGDAGSIEIESYPVDEFCYVIEGEVTLTDVEGESRTFKTGDAFLVPAGFKGVWGMNRPTIKYFVCHGEIEMVSHLLGGSR